LVQWLILMEIQPLTIRHFQVVIHKQKAVVRFCLMHILATNLSVWLSTTTHETAEDIGRASARSLSNVPHGMNATRGECVS
jgi:uncharacterized membrane protein